MEGTDANGPAPCPLGTTTTTTAGRQRASARWVTVEPVIAATMVAVSSVGLIRPLFVRSRISQEHNATAPNGTAICGAEEALTSAGLQADADNSIQSEASLFLLYLGLASGIPSILSSAVLCTMTDKLGRKMAMALPLCGLSCQAAVYLAVVGLGLPLQVLLAGDILYGLSGGFGLTFAAGIAYITDVTAEDRRTMRIVLAETVSLLVGGATEVGQGFLLRAFSFQPTVAVGLAASLLGLLYILIPPFLIETVDKAGTGSKTLREVGDSMVKLLKVNENGRRWQMLLLDLFIFLSMCQLTGSFSILVLYGSGEPFCWDTSISGIALAATFFAVSIGMALGTKLFSLCLGEYWIMHLSCLSMALVFITLGLAKSTLVIFIGIFLGCLRGIAIPVGRTIVSRITSSEETGAAFALVGCLESLSSMVSGLAASGLYAATVAVMPSLTFFAYAGFTSVPMGILVVLQVFWPRRKQYVPLVSEPSLSINSDLSEGASS